jgi:hypothetical protein
MLPRIKSGVRVAALLPSPTLRAVARVMPGRDGKAGATIEQESKIRRAAAWLLGYARDAFLLRPADAFFLRR